MRRYSWRHLGPSGPVAQYVCSCPVSYLGMYRVRDRFLGCIQTCSGGEEEMLERSFPSGRELSRRSSSLCRAGGANMCQLANQSRKTPFDHNRRADIDQASPVFSHLRPRLAQRLLRLSYHHHYHHIIVTHC